MKEKHKILILGGGYAGVMAASRLVINGVRATPANITLIDARTELVQRIRLHETLAGSTPRTLPYRILERRGIRFIQARVESLEPGRRRVLARTPGGERLEMEYDTLIYTLGSRTAAPAPGVDAQAVDPATVENPSAFLMRTVTRLCIDTLGAARNRLTDYVGPWLPEPLIQDTSGNPESLRELADDLSTAFLLLLERLNPVERAVFLLRESFDFSHKEIAEVIGKTEENCRQIDRRARQKLSGVPRPRPADPEEHDRLLYGFLQASREGDMQGMLNLLARDAVCTSDGGGKSHAAKVPLVGAERVAKFISGLQAKAQVPFEVRLAQVNGRTGFITYVEGRVVNVGTMRIEDGLIREIFIQVNPEKLP